MKFISFQKKTILCFAILFINQSCYGSDYYNNEYEERQVIKALKTQTQLIDNLEHILETWMLSQQSQSSALKKELEKNKKFKNLNNKYKSILLRHLLDNIDQHYNFDKFKAIIKLASEYKATPDPIHDEAISQADVVLEEIEVTLRSPNSSGNTSYQRRIDQRGDTSFQDEYRRTQPHEYSHMYSTDRPLHGPSSIIGEDTGSGDQRRRSGTGRVSFRGEYEYEDEYNAYDPVRHVYERSGFIDEIRRIIINWSNLDLPLQKDLESKLKNNFDFNHLELKNKVILLKHLASNNFIDDDEQKNSLIQRTLASIASSYSGSTKTFARYQPSNTPTAISAEQLFQSTTSTSYRHPTERSTPRGDAPRSINLTDEQQADILIKNSYISPEMQYAVLSLVGLSWNINPKTGVTYNIPTMEEIINKIINELSLITHQTHNINTNPLLKEKTIEMIVDSTKSALEAVNIAIFIDSVQRIYQDDSYLFYPTSNYNVYNILNGYKERLTSILQYSELRPALASQISSMSSWISSFVWPNNPSKSDNQMDQIILQNNYKNIKYDSSGIKAANLLFKQCFIAQKHYLDSASANLGMIVDLNINNPDDLLDNVPNINEFINIAYRAAQETSSRGTASEKAQHLTSIHKHILNVRQAIQTALYIANANSSYNFSYIPSLRGLLGFVPQPSYLATYLDPIVHTLSQYDKKLAEMSIDKKLGASNNDVFRNQIWTTISYIAGGLAVGAIVGYDYNYGFIKGARDTVSNAYKNLFKPAQIQPDKLNTPTKTSEKELLKKLATNVGVNAEKAADIILAKNYKVVKPISTSVGNKINDFFSSTNNPSLQQAKP